MTDEENKLIVYIEFLSLDGGMALAQNASKKFFLLKIECK